MNDKRMKILHAKLHPFLFALGVGLMAGCVGRATVVVTATPSPFPQPTVIPTSFPTNAPSASLAATPIPDNPAVVPTDALPAAAAQVMATVSPVPPTATPTPTFDGLVPLWMAPNVANDLQPALDQVVKAGAAAWAKEENSRVKLVSVPRDQAGNAGLSAQWVYAPVMAFPTIADNVNWGDIQRYWKGDLAALAPLTNNKQPPIFVATAATFAWLTALLGSPSPNLKVELVPPDAVVTTLWLRRPAAFGLAPFHQLDPAMKVLTLDNVSVFNRNMDIARYPLVETFSFTGDPTLVNQVVAAVKATERWVATNRDLSKMTIMVLTGVTALTRATAYEMELKGIVLPVRDILPFLQDAEFIHTSNEVSFTKNCPDPNPVSESLLFCSKESYFDLLKTMRLNVVELTGNHVNDWGTDAFVNSLDIYNANKIGYFGGGRNLDDARKALIVSHNGNTIAFIGCNQAGPGPAYARKDRPGAAQCDDAYLSKEIPRLKTVANIVIMSIQYQEFYQYRPTPEQVNFFQKYARLGANMVMGSQAHQPQAFAFTGSAFIHYGYGNLFFDQMDVTPTRQMFADKIIIYNGKHLSTVLFTGLIEDSSRPRPMTAQERIAFLTTIFRASGW